MPQLYLAPIPLQHTSGPDQWMSVALILMRPNRMLMSTAEIPILRPPMLSVALLLSMLLLLTVALPPLIRPGFVPFAA